MNQRPTKPGDRLPLLITIGVFAVMLACLPLVWLMDGTTDEDRPMYHDMLEMQTYQGLLIGNEEPPVETTVSGGKSVMIGAHKFTPSKGVTVVVRATDQDSYCVTASNELGQRAEERCSK